MTIQEEIRKGIVTQIQLAFTETPYQTADAIIAYLHWHDVVIKVKRDLPETTLCNCGHPQTAHHNKEGFCGVCACTWYYSNLGIVDMLKVGYTAVEPLVNPTEK